MTAFVYILLHDNGHYYIGSTSDMERRLIQHRSGHTKTTKRLGHFTLVLKQGYPTLSGARIVERRLKRLKRKDYIEKIVHNGYIK